jgi:hypothetical protein
LRKLEIAAAIEKDIAGRAERAELTADLVVDELRKFAFREVRVHPSRLTEEDASFLWHRRCTVEQMFERGEARSSRMAALDRLGKLHLVADQDNVLGANAHCDRIGEDTCPASSTNR